MKRLSFVAVAFALLVVSAQPVSAAPILGSINTTDSDFSNASEKQDFVVDGTGSAASIKSTGLIDDFSDGDKISTAGHGWSDWIGDLDKFDANGRLTATSSNSYINVDGPGTTSPISLRMNFILNSAGDLGKVTIEDGTDQEVVRVQATSQGSSAELSINGNVVDTKTGIASNTWDITIVPDFDNNEAELIVDGTSQGSFGFLSGRSASEFSDLNFAVTNDDQINSIDLADLYVGAQPSEVSGPVWEGAYIGNPHSGNAVQGSTYIETLSDATVTLRWQGSDGGPWTTVDTEAGVTSTGWHNVSLSGQYAEYRLKVTAEKSSRTGEVSIGSESILVESSDPTFDSANATPNNNNDVASNDPTLSIPVDDPDFQNDASDEVTVEFFVDGNSVGTDTLTSAGTASVSTGDVSGGNHSWYAVATDSVGGSDTSDEFTFLSPLTLYIHDGNDQNYPLLNQDVNITAFGTSEDSDYVNQTTVSNGEFVMGDVPNEQIKFVLNSSGRASRSIIINDPYGEAIRRTVLYNATGAGTYDQCFSLDSAGAGFAPDRSWVTLRVYINDSWRDAAGGYFGAVNIQCMTVQDESEYRLVVSDGDDRRSLGGYVADKSYESTTLPLLVEGTQFSFDRGTDFSWEVSSAINESDHGNVTFKFDSGDAEVSDLNLVVREEGNSTPIFDESQNGEVTSSVWLVELGPNQTDEELIVEWNARRGASAGDPGEEIGATEKIRVGYSDGGIGFDPKWSGAAAGFVLILVGGMFGAAHAEIGAILVPVIGSILTLSGFISIGGLAISLALALGVLGYVAAASGG